MKLILVIFSLIFIPHPQSVFAQASYDTSKGNSSANYLLTRYQFEAGDRLHLYSGSEYVSRGNGVKGTAFLNSGDIVKGTVYFEGRQYNNIPLQYDMESDEVVIRDFNNNYNISLVKEKTAGFILDGHEFVRLFPDSINTLTKEWFYELLFNDKLKVWAKRQKRITYTISTEGTVNRFTQTNEYFLEKDGRFYSVDGERALLSVLKDKRTLLKKYKSDNKIKFGKNPEEGIIQMSRYYSQQKG